MQMLCCWWFSACSWCCGWFSGFVERNERGESLGLKGIESFLSFERSGRNIALEHAFLRVTRFLSANCLISQKRVVIFQIYFYLILL